jgi:hypothetical protein
MQVGYPVAAVHTFTQTVQRIQHTECTDKLQEGETFTKRNSKYKENMGKQFGMCGGAPSLRVIPWHLTEKPQGKYSVGVFDGATIYRWYQYSKH